MLQDVRYISTHERGGEVDAPENREADRQHQANNPTDNFSLGQSFKHGTSITSEMELCESALDRWRRAPAIRF
jgi:hypothetical protein